MQAQTANPNPNVGKTAGYWKVGGVLALLTALEVGCVYVEALKGHLALILVVIGIIKFALVAMYFMHLKGDAPVYTGFFLAGIIIAVASFLGVLAMNPAADAALSRGGL